MSSAFSSSLSRDERAVVSTLARHLVIRASAGSGKTYQLVIRYLGMLLEGVPAEQILASTFTRKAAGEILGRILGRLAVAARDPNDLAQLAAHLGRPEFDRHACLALLQSLASALHRMRVGTLDSFFGRLAKSYTLELGLPPGWDIVDELEDAALRAQAIAVVLREGNTSDVRRLTNLLSKGDSARSVSGKLRETVDGYYGIYQQTDAAAWHQFPELFPLSAEARDAAIASLETVELPDLKQHRNARDADCQRAALGNWEDFLTTGFPEKILRGLRTFGSSKREISDEALAIYKQLINHARAIVLRERAARTAAIYELLVKFDAVYQRLKREERRLRFDDISLRLAEAFGEQPVGRLMSRLDSDVSHLLLDEFQDTSRSQWAVLRPFAERITAEDQGTSFFCVGDVKQAIYGWRGGVAEIFDAVDEQLSGVEMAQLIESRRSSQVIIDTVNRLFTGLARHENLQGDEGAVRDWCDSFEEHRTALDIAGYATVETPTEADAPDATKIKERVIAAAARRVAEVAAAAPQAEIAVLVRQNKTIAPVIHELQRRWGIDASEEGGNPLTDSAAVQLLLSLVKLADHPGDTAARFHIAQSPLAAVLSFSDHRDARAAAHLAAEVRRQLADDSYGVTVESWTRSLLPHVSRRDQERLGQFVELAYRYESQATLRPSRFVQFVESTRVDAPSPATVRVMSIHQAKGLQFDAVVLPLVEERLIARPPKFIAAGHSPAAKPELVFDYPGVKIQQILPETFQQACATAHAAQVREEVCALYVAATRAAQALHIIVPPAKCSEKQLPRSLAGFVRAALANEIPAGPGALLYEHGDANWSAVDREGPLAKSEVGEPSASTEAASRLTVKLAEMTDGRRRGLGRTAPSQMEAAVTIRLTQMVTGSRAEALKRGTLIHAWFEQIEWLENGWPEEGFLRKIAQQQGCSQESTQGYLDEFQEMLSRSAIKEVLSKEAYLSQAQPPWPRQWWDELSTDSLELVVDRERPIVVRIDAELLNGTIDRLVLLRQGGTVVAADIIDFKTDTVGEGGAAAFGRTAHYRRQLDAYVAAISRIYRLPLERITARLAFVESGEIVSVPAGSAHEP